MALDVWWEGDTFSGGTYTGVRTLDVSSSLDPDERRLSVNVVNRHVTDALDIEIELGGGSFAGTVKVATITGADLKTTNTVARPNEVCTTERSLEISSAHTFGYTLPPRSVTVLAFAL